MTVLPAVSESYVFERAFAAAYRADDAVEGIEPLIRAYRAQPALTVSRMIVRARRYFQAVVFRVLRGAFVFEIPAAGVQHLHRVHLARQKLDIRDIKILSEGMRVHHVGPLGAHEIEIAVYLQLVYVGVRLEPGLVQTVGKEIAAQMRELPAEEDPDAELCPFLRRQLIAAAEKVYPLVPGQVDRHGRVAPEEMIGYDYAVKALLFIKAYLIHGRRGSAAADLGGMHMSFV